VTSPTDSLQEGYALLFQNVTFRLPSGALLISNLNLSVARGETIILLGRSGSGKTTTLKLINRLLDPTDGEILMNGKPIRSLNPIELRRGIGYVIQDAGLFPHWTVERNVGLVPKLDGWPEEKIRARVHEMLSLVGLPPGEFAERRP
jgi:osmoprotectant transport system ATP-binding protein